MFLKKEVFQLPFSKIKSFNFEYQNEEDLKMGIMKILDMLKKNDYVIQVFSVDEINEKIRSISKHKSFSRLNFSYYKLEDVTFLKNINLSSLRFMNIFTLEKDDINFDRLVDNSPFIICFDNYLEIANLKINVCRYEDNILKEFKV